jgi:hypothetical protein
MVREDGAEVDDVWKEEVGSCRGRKKRPFELFAFGVGLHFRGKR